jgi:hypothetical protein
MQRTLNRELKELEVVGREANVTCVERLSGRGLFIYGDTPVIRVWDGNVPESGPTLPQLGSPAGIS